MSILALFLATVAFPPTCIDDWSTWRGPTEDGIAGENAIPPLEWSEDGNVLWAVDLPGLGCSSPVILGDRIYMTTAIDLEAVPEGEEPEPQPGAPNADHMHRFVVFALDRETGEEVWSTSVGEAQPHEKGHKTGSHASPSVQTNGKQLLAFFGSRGLYALDMEGTVLWSKDFGDMKTLAEFGEGSTPAVHGDTVVVQWDEEGPSFVAAFDTATGEERWRTDRDCDSSWGSPVVTTVGGRAQAILTGTDSTRAYDLETGEEVWWCEGISKNPVNSPVLADGVVYVMNSYKGTFIQAIELAQAKGEVKEGAGLLWAKSRDASYVPLPVVVNGRLYYLRDSTGVLTCLDARTGDLVYSAQRLGSVKRIHASLIAAAGRLYITSREGGTVVVQEGPEFEVLATNPLNDVFDATPAFVGSSIYLRGRSRLYRVAAAER